jgi:hypothetical protein
MLIVRGSYSGPRLSARSFLRFAFLIGSGKPARGQQAGASRPWLMPSRTRNRIIGLYWPVGPCLTTIAVVFCRGQITFRQHFWKCAFGLPLRQKC